MENKIGGVIVAYRPELLEFAKVVQAASAEVHVLVIVNNGDTPIAKKPWGDDTAASERVHILENGDNLGVATGINIGLRYLTERGCSHFLLLDQDSSVPPGMVAKLLGVLLRTQMDGLPIACVGPRYYDEQQKKWMPFVFTRGLHLRQLHCSGSNDIIEAQYLITSGTLIPLDSLKKIGPMGDELFIDYVDFEWGLRARSLGYRIFGVCSVGMKHKLGDAPIQFLGMPFPNRPPFRHYYMVRNAIHLYKRPYIPLNWKLVDCMHLMLRFFFYALVPKNRADHFRMMYRGLLDGFRGKVGRAIFSDK